MKKDYRFRRCVVKKKKLVYGVGINDADYIIQKTEVVGYENGKRRQRLIWICPYYRKWQSMLRRCYSYNMQSTTNPTYIDCSVCEEWLTFSNFKRWMEKQDWEGKELDKDLLFPGNKLYSPATCVFLSKQINMFITENRCTRGEFLVGVHWDKVNRKFSATGNRGRGERKKLGRFDTELEAHKAWLAFKLEQAKILAAEQTDPRVAKALIERYENYVIEE
jgi:hypothetical protein